MRDVLARHGAWVECRVEKSSAALSTRPRSLAPAARRRPSGRGRRRRRRGSRVAQHHGGPVSRRQWPICARRLASRRGRSRQVTTPSSAGNTSGHWPAPARNIGESSPAVAAPVATTMAAARALWRRGGLAAPAPSPTAAGGADSDGSLGSPARPAGRVSCVAGQPVRRRRGGSRRHWPPWCDGQAGDR